jgi:hypothetical protein
VQIGDISKLITNEEKYVQKFGQVMNESGWMDRWYSEGSLGISHINVHIFERRARCAAFCCSPVDERSAALLPPAAAVFVVVNWVCWFCVVSMPPLAGPFVVFVACCCWGMLLP